MIGEESIVDMNSMSQYRAGRREGINGRHELKGIGGHKGGLKQMEGRWER
jgi:hypothetical protein